MSDDERPRAAWLVVWSDAAWRPHGAREILSRCVGQILLHAEGFVSAARDEK
jgi:hypothetical protein